MTVKPMRQFPATNAIGAGAASRAAQARVLPRLERSILKTLLYFDIWNHPLSERELCQFLGVPVPTTETLQLALGTLCASGQIHSHEGFFYLKGRSAESVTRRCRRQRHARWMWHVARAAMHVIKRFPFVRAVLVSGELSKNATGRGSDIDFFIVAEEGRLWICRSLLVLFKKVFLLNSKKFFCLNYFATPEGFPQNERNLYTATEVATLRVLYSQSHFLRFMDANRWIKAFFPNFEPRADSEIPSNDRQSLMQRALELALGALPLDALDTFLMRLMHRVWRERYPELDAQTREKIFLCTKSESRAYVGNFQGKILASYGEKLSAVLGAGVRGREISKNLLEA